MLLPMTPWVTPPVIPAFDLVVAHKNANIDQTPDGNVSMFDYQTILQMLIAGRCDGPCR